MMPDENQNDGRKRPYAKPEMTRVLLVTEEAVFAGCKSTTLSGPGYSGKCTGQLYGDCSDMLS